MFPQKINNWINNQECESTSNQWMQNICPSDGKVICDVARSSVEDVEKALSAAKKAQGGWANMTPYQRGEVLFSMVAKLEEKRELVAEIVAKETGKSYNDSFGEVGAAIAQGRFMAGEGARFGGRIIPSAVTNKQVLVVREPMGVAGLIIASNTPIANVAWKVFPALICGNTAILKASEDTPGTADIFAKLAKEAGLPDGVLNVVHGYGHEAGAALIENPNIDVISFTGSTRVGKWIQKTVGERLTKIFLELGGKNPLVVCDDADLDEALKWALSSSFSNAGQRCASSSRIIVFDAVYEEFKERFITETKKLVVGSHNDAYLGPVINEKQLNNMLSHIEDAQKEGATLLTGGKRYIDNNCADGFFLEPTIIENVDPQAPISQTELFGPITCMYRVNGFEECVELANNSLYGLTSAIHTKNLDVAFEFSRRIKAGVVGINGGTHGSEAHMPFGGVKNSGNGLREPGIEALEVYSSKKNIAINISNNNL